jgi:hypothetical protein
MAAGYRGAWISSFEEALDHVMNATAPDRREARDGLLLALSDGAVASRWADTQEPINSADLPPKKWTGLGR